MQTFGSRIKIRVPQDALRLPRGELGFQLDSAGPSCFAERFDDRDTLAAAEFALENDKVGMRRSGSQAELVALHRNFLEGQRELAGMIRERTWHARPID